MMNLPDSAPIIELIEAFRRSKTMFTAVSMGIFDRLKRAPATAEAFAAGLGAHPAATGQLLDACAALGLLQKQDQTYRLTPLAETYLCSSSPHSLDGYIRYSDEALYPMWGHLADAVREGAPRWKQVFGVDGPIFSGFFRTEKAKRTFMQGMHGLGMTVSPRVVEAFDLGAFRHMVDVGGGTGHLTIAACSRWPELRAVVFDLPRVTPMAREMVGQSGLAARIETADGDFFADDLPQGDLYALGRILHDWSDEKCHLLLSRISSRLPSGGALLIMEKILAEDGVGPVSANLQSLNMLVVTEGRERSLGEYTHILKAAGFTDVQGRPTGGWLDAILARK